MPKAHHTYWRRERRWYVHPVVGARLHVSGINEKGGLKSLGKTYDYKFVTSNIDLMFNLCNAFAPKSIMCSTPTCLVA